MRFCLAFLSVFACCGPWPCLLGQPVSSLIAVTDTTVCTLNDVFALVEAHHPIARQAALMPARAQATLRMARGGFDPKVYGSYGQKYFDKKEYYTTGEGGLKIPTWIGADIKAAYEWNDGVYINPEDKLPGGGLGTIGASIPLAQGLLIDQRRTTLRQAKIFAQTAEARQWSMLNDLYMEAAKNYWEWALAYNTIQLYRSSVVIARQRLDGVKQMFLVGDEPGIDTLEANIQLQTRMLGLSDARLDYQKSTLNVSNFLWASDGMPLEITERLHPIAFSDTSMMERGNAALLLDAYLGRVEENHPDIRQLRYALADLEAERRMKVEKLKPKINANYNLLSEQFTFGDARSTAFSPNNYKWGLEVSFPLYLREERGNVALTRLKMRETELKQSQKILEISNKLRSYAAEVNFLTEQILLYESAVAGYLTLVRAEESKFQIGESSLFLINARELKWIEACEKLLTLQAKYQKATLGMRWAAGNLYELE